jgi:hypothetical protein
MVFSATLKIFQLYLGGQFYWRRKPEYLEKTIDLSQVATKNRPGSAITRVFLSGKYWSNDRFTTSAIYK